jgi:hypothetical protein
VAGVGYLLWLRPNNSCILHGPFAAICQADKWPAWAQDLLLIPSIWLLFLLCWCVALVFGVSAIEIPGPRQKGPIARFFQSMSEFGPIRVIILIYGLVALLGIILMWYQQAFDPVAFALASIIVFLAHCSFFQTLDPTERRMYLTGYGLAALGAIVIMFVFGRFQDAIFATELIIVLVGAWAFFFWRPQPAQQGTAQDQLNANLARTVTPVYVLRSIPPFSLFFPNRPNVNP